MDERDQLMEAKRAVEARLIAATGAQEVPPEGVHIRVRPDDLLLFAGSGIDGAGVMKLLQSSAASVGVDDAGPSFLAFWLGWELRRVMHP